MWRSWPKATLGCLWLRSVANTASVTPCITKWKSEYSGVSVNELKRVRELEAENSKLKKMFAELALENAAIKDVLSRKL